MTDAWEMHQAETGLTPYNGSSKVPATFHPDDGPVWRDRGVIIANLTLRNQALEERVAELEGSCQKLRDDYQGALAETRALRARIEALADEWDRFATSIGDESLPDVAWNRKHASEVRALAEPQAVDTTRTEQQAHEYPDRWDGGPHSRACGAFCQGHGSACHRNCPTCGGYDFKRDTP